MSRYFVTYFKQTMAAGANPCNHTGIMLSVQHSFNTPPQVIDCFGFYSTRSSTYHPIHKGIKTLLNVKFDVQNGHGYLKREVMRYLVGKGLYGVSFEVSQDKYRGIYYGEEGLLARLHREKAEIKRLDERLRRDRRPINGPNRYREACLLSYQNETSSLRPFHIALHLNRFHLDSSLSNSCKLELLAFLRQHEVINDAIYQDILNTQLTQAFPFSSKLSFKPIHLKAMGAFKADVSSQGQVYLNPHWEDNPLLWTHDPYLIEPENYIQQSKTKIKYLRDIRKDCLIYHHKIQLKRLAIQHMIVTLQHRCDSYEEDDEKRQVLKVQINRLRGVTEGVSDLLNRMKQDKVALDALYHKLSEYHDVAHLTLHQDKAKFSPHFILRVMTNPYSTAAALSLLGLAIALALVGNSVLGIALATGCALLGARQLYGFYKSETKYARERRNYDAFLKPEMSELCY